MRCMAAAPTHKASGLDADFKLLAEFNDCVLAGRFSGEGRGVQFVTWEGGYGRKGLYHGHYYENDYEGAKADFAQRAGLIDRNRFFTDEQLRLISPERTVNHDFATRRKRFLTRQHLKRCQLSLRPASRALLLSRNRPLRRLPLRVTASSAGVATILVCRRLPLPLRQMA